MAKRLVEKTAFAIIAITLVGACSESNEATKLGFGSVSEMKRIHDLGWHTKKKYDEDQRAYKEVMRAEASELGFADVGEMEAAAQKGIKNGQQWRQFQAAEQRRIAEANAKQERERLSLHPACKSTREKAKNICVAIVMRGQQRVDAYNDCITALEAAEQTCGYKITLEDVIEEWKKEQTR